jgi:hypothetical protein
MVTPKDASRAEENADVAKTIYQQANELRGREGVGSETRKLAGKVEDTANRLHTELRELVQHIEKNEDIA